MNSESLNRRKLLKNSILTAGIIGAGALTSVKAKAEAVCRLTAAQPEGPFYPIKDQFDKNNDLTIVDPNGDKKARGKVVILTGIVKDQACSPVAGALVEIWQACDTGKYDHHSDPNQANLYPNFQYWGRAMTNSKGEYSFKTIKPGSYKATNTWTRPPHIHLKVHLRGFEELTTQVYFADETKLNSTDRILSSLNSKDQKDCIVKFHKTALNSNFPMGIFNIHIKEIL
jgi:protocatechuate 3,4-dioxygenase beta subunit